MTVISTSTTSTSGSNIYYSQSPMSPMTPLSPDAFKDCAGLVSAAKNYSQPPYGIVEKVEEIVPFKVIRVTFIDGDVQKAVCCDEDEFDFERGIEICICKHLIGGTKEFNKQIKKALKCYDDAIDKELDELMEENRIKVKKEKRAEQKKRREERRLAEEKEKQIQIQTEAILRAKKIWKEK